MRIISARQAWHDAHYQPWDSVMSVAADWAKLGTAVQTTAKAVTANHAAHQALAGRVQAAIATLPLCLQAFGHHMYSPLATDADREDAEGAVFALAVSRVEAMREKKYGQAAYVARGVLHRYRVINQGGMGRNQDLLEAPASFVKWIKEVYGVKLAEDGIELSEQNWARDWGAFVEACFSACNELDWAALRPVAMTLEAMKDVA